MFFSKSQKSIVVARLGNGAGGCKVIIRINHPDLSLYTTNLILFWDIDYHNLLMSYEVNNQVEGLRWLGRKGFVSWRFFILLFIYFFVFLVTSVVTFLLLARVPGSVSVEDALLRGVRGPDANEEREVHDFASTQDNNTTSIHQLTLHTPLNIPPLELAKAELVFNIIR